MRPTKHNTSMLYQLLAYARNGKVCAIASDGGFYRITFEENMTKKPGENMIVLSEMPEVYYEKWFD